MDTAFSSMKVNGIAALLKEDKEKNQYKSTAQSLETTKTTESHPILFKPPSATDEVSVTSSEEAQFEEALKQRVLLSRSSNGRSPMPEFYSLSQQNGRLKRELFKEATIILQKYEELRNQVEVYQKHEEELVKLNKIQEKTIQHLLLKLNEMKKRTGGGLDNSFSVEDRDIAMTKLVEEVKSKEKTIAMLQQQLKDHDEAAMKMREHYEHQIQEREDIIQSVKKIETLYSNPEAPMVDKHVLYLFSKQYPESERVQEFTKSSTPSDSMINSRTPLPVLRPSSNQSSETKPVFSHPLLNTIFEQGSKFKPSPSPSIANHSFSFHGSPPKPRISTLNQSSTPAPSGGSVIDHVVEKRSQSAMGSFAPGSSSKQRTKRKGV